MIKINTITEAVAELFGPDDKKIGDITSSLQFNDVRIQIKKECKGQKGRSGYYVIWNDERIDIDVSGHCDEWPKGFFDHIDIQLTALCGWDE